MDVADGLNLFLVLPALAIDDVFLVLLFVLVIDVLLC